MPGNNFAVAAIIFSAVVFVFVIDFCVSLETVIVPSGFSISVGSSVASPLLFVSFSSSLSFSEASVPITLKPPVPAIEFPPVSTAEISPISSLAHEAIVKNSVLNVPLYLSVYTGSFDFL